MVKVKIFYLNLILLLFLVGTSVSCMPRKATDEPPLSVWHVELTPALQWMEVMINLCTQQTSDVAIDLVERPANALFQQKVDFTFLWGETEKMAGMVVELGWDELVVVVNPMNPVDNIAVETLRAAFVGRIRNMEDLDGGNKKSELQVWGYGQGNEVQAVFEEGLTAASGRNPYLKLSPNPAMMRQVISVESNAVGYLPKRWVDNSVKAVTITGLELLDWQVPILAVVTQTPDEAKKDWLVCLQKSIQP
jgi:hypothetical protein